MSKAFIPLAIALALLSAGLADAPATLEGDWKIVSMEMNGKALPKEKIGKAGYRFDGGKVTRTNADGSTVKPIAYTTDASHTPAWMDWNDQGGASLGVYELAGDSLKLCFGPDPQPDKPSVRPGEVSSKAGFLIVMERAKP